MRSTSRTVGGNAEAVFVDTNNSDGSTADKPFQLVVVC